MNYCFHPKTEKTELDDIFPISLSWFSERVGAFDNDSEFKQLEKILDIDLKIINHMEYDWDDDFCSIKTSVTELEEVVKHLKKAIDLNPVYFESINYQDHRPEDCKSYFSSGEFEKDIDELQRIVELYKSKDIQELEISYM